MKFPIKNSLILLLSIALSISINSCSHAKNQNSIYTYNVIFESNDIGDVRFVLDLNLNSGKISGGSKIKGYYDNFSLIDIIKIKCFAGIKNNRLIYIEGIYEGDSNDIKFHTAFFSPLGNYYFDGSIKNNKIEGKLLTGKGIVKGIIHGNKNNNHESLNDYRELSNSIVTTFEKNFFNPDFLTTSTYKKFKNKIISYSSLAQDDLHFVFSAFYYMRSLPYSHIGLWRKSGVKEKELSNNQSKELFKYDNKGDNAILTINSFTSKPGELENQMIEIINDNPKNLIIDLRNNSGGNIGPAIELCKYLISSPTSGGYFLTQNYYKQKNTDIKNCYEFHDGDLDTFMHALKNNTCVEVKIEPASIKIKSKIYILVNKNTASTCEPIIYALKKDNNITLVGTSSAGKMLSAEEFKLKNNFYLYVPIADFVTTDNKRLDQIGVKPELETKTDALKYVLDLLTQDIKKRQKQIN